MLKLDLLTIFGILIFLIFIADTVCEAQTNAQCNFGWPKAALVQIN